MPDCHALKHVRSTSVCDVTISVNLKNREGIAPNMFKLLRRHIVNENENLIANFEYVLNSLLICSDELLVNLHMMQFL